MGRHDLALENNAAKRGGPKEPKKQRKAHVGWMGPSMVRYFNENRAEKNKLRRVARHARRHPGDHQAFLWVKEHAPKSVFDALTFKIGTEWLERLG